MAQPPMARLASLHRACAAADPGPPPFTTARPYVWLWAERPAAGRALAAAR